jgi:hypothetical protein
MQCTRGKPPSQGFYCDFNSITADFLGNLLDENCGIGGLMQVPLARLVIERFQQLLCRFPVEIVARSGCTTALLSASAMWRNSAVDEHGQVRISSCRSNVTPMRLSASSDMLQERFQSSEPVRVIWREAREQ